MKPATQIIDRVVITEKGTRLQTENKYVFRVDRHATKRDIRRAIEELFQVHVIAVNTMNRAGKKKRERRPNFGRTASWKRAVVTLKAGESIPLQ